MLALSVPSHLPACTIFVSTRAGRVLVGNNEDAPFKFGAKAWFTPNRDGFFGRVCFGWDGEPGWAPVAQGGMNEEGLFFDFAACPRTDTPYDPDKPHFRYNFGEKILAECSTVKQAIRMFQAYTLPEQHGVFGHFLIADATGDSAVIEQVEGKLTIIARDKDFQVATNFYLSKPSLGGYPCKRYDRATEALKTLAEPSADAIRSVLKSVSGRGRSASGEEGGTLYSNIYDLKNREVIVYYKQGFDKPLKIRLAEELAKGAHTIDLQKLAGGL
jgi:choloylglycine hydrolase